MSSSSITTNPTEYHTPKTKLSQLTEAEKEGFLKWGGYSIQHNETDDNTLIVLDESKKPFSKNGMKRVIKRYFQSINRPQHKKLVKQRKRKRKRELLELETSQSTDNAQTKCTGPPPAKKRRLRSKNLRRFVQHKLDNNPYAPCIVLDCRFNGLMDHQQVVSVSAQLRQLYGVNMKAPIPCNLYATSFGGGLKAQFRNKSSDNDEDGLAILDVWRMHFIEQSMEEYFVKEIKEDKKEFVYLSAESEYELERIEDDKIYVIGAFMDRNRYKGYTNNLANDNGWKTAKLPILKYMKVNEKDAAAHQTRLVITIDQVFAILIALYNWNDWRKALQFAFPSRKGFVLKEPLSEQEIEKLVFDGHMIPIECNEYRKSAKRDTNHNNKNCEQSVVEDNK